MQEPKISIRNSTRNIDHLGAHQIPPHLTFACPQARLRNRLKQKQNNLNVPTIANKEPK